MRALASAVRAAFCLVLFVAPGARADVIVLDQARIDECRIQAIRNALVFYIDQKGAVGQAPIDEIEAIGFTGLHQLDDAERYLSRGDREGALTKLLEAYVAAETAVQRQWIHGRLAETHGALGDFIEAAGHFGAVLETDPSTPWLHLKPEGEPNAGTFYSLSEAEHYLSRASRRAEDPMVKEAVESLLSVIEPLYERVRALPENEDLDWRSSWTVSGILLRDVGKPRPPRERGGGAAADAPRERAVPGNTSNAAKGDEIEPLLEAGRYREALALCEAAAKDPGSRDLGLLLFQFGRALNGLDRREDAAVQFMRCAILFPATAYAAASLVETAIFYRDLYQRPQKARTLLDEAIETADAIGDAAIRERAEEILKTLSPAPTRPRGEL